MSGGSPRDALTVDRSLVCNATNEWLAKTFLVSTERAKIKIIRIALNWYTMIFFLRWKKIKYSIFICSDGSQLTEEGNAFVHREVVHVLIEAGISAQDMQLDFPHHFEIEEAHPEHAFQQGNKKLPYFICTICVIWVMFMYFNCAASNFRWGLLAKLWAAFADFKSCNVF